MMAGGTESLAIAPSAALEAVALFDKIRFSSDLSFLPLKIGNELGSLGSDSDIQGIPDSYTTSAFVSALLGRVLSPGTLATLRVERIPEVIARARPIASRVSLHGDQADSFHDAVAHAAFELCRHGSAVESLCTGIRSSGFSEWWHDAVRPGLVEDSQALRRKAAAFDVDHVLFLVSKLRGIKQADTVWVYLLHCSRPFSYHVGECEAAQSRQEATDGRALLRSVAHQLMHGFASSALVSAYQKAVAADPYLRKLVEHGDWSRGMGPEEMFVRAADLYISHKAGLYSLEEAFAILDGSYGKRLPLAVIILDLLLRTQGLPGTYDSWLLQRFRDGTLRVGRIADQVDEILPGYSE
jgi:hypothetical protein